MTPDEAFNVYYENHLKLQLDQFDTFTANELKENSKEEFFKRGHYYVSYGNTAPIDVVLDNGIRMESAEYYANYAEAQIARLRCILKYNDISEYHADTEKAKADLEQLIEEYPEYGI